MRELPTHEEEIEILRRWLASPKGRRIMESVRPSLNTLRAAHFTAAIARIWARVRRAASLTYNRIRKCLPTTKARKS